jgi:hypothetical protein
VGRRGWVGIAAVVSTGALLGGGLVALTVTSAGASTQTVTFAAQQCPTGPSTPQTWTVPAGVTSATFDVLGAGGGGSDSAASGIGGMGGEARATLAVTPGETLRIDVGCAGGFAGTLTGGVGGYNGGANGGLAGGGAGGGGGGGVIGGGGGGASAAVTGPGAGGGGGSGLCPAVCLFSSHSAVAAGSDGSVSITFTTAPGTAIVVVPRFTG